MRNINFFGLTGLCPNHPFVDYNEKDCRDDSELNRLCKLVYAADERTGLPSSDLTVLFSDSVPADIAAWVRQNLQMPHNLDGVSSIKNGQQIDDDTILQLTRGKSESREDYINRVNSFLVSQNEGSN